MKYCLNCKRLFTGSNCIYCDKKETGAILRLPESPSRRIKLDLENIKVGEKNYKVKGIVDRGSTAVILDLLDHKGKPFALKTPLDILENFSDQIREIDDVDKSIDAIKKEIRILNNLEEYPLKIEYAGYVVFVSSKREELKLPVILMEKIIGNLANLYLTLNEFGYALSYDEKANIIGSVIYDVEKYHTKELIHRDIAPQNIFITEDSKKKGAISYLVADLGSAKNISKIRSWSVDYLSHRPYTAPETRIDGKHKKPQDIYSLGLVSVDIILGVVWYQYFSADHEFDNDDLSGTLNFERDYLPKLKPLFLPGIYRVIKKAIAFDPKRRYRTMSDFYMDMLSALNEKQEFLRRDVSKCVEFKILYEIKIPYLEKVKEIEVLYDGANTIQVKKNNSLNIKFLGKIVSSAKILTNGITPFEVEYNTREVSVRVSSEMEKIFRRDIHEGQGDFVIQLQVEFKDEN